MRVEQTTIINPTAPTPSPSAVTAAVAAITQVATNLNQSCPISATHKARAFVDGIEVGTSWIWSVTNTPEPKAFNRNGDEVTTVFDLPGNYRITAMATVNGQTVSAQTDVVLSGSGCRSSGPEPEVPDCRDSRDNDGDGKIDFPADPGCTNPDDDDDAFQVL